MIKRPTCIILFYGYSIFYNSCLNSGCISSVEMPELNITYPYESVSWSPEGGYPESVRVDEVPWRSWGPGSHLGLTVVLDANLDEYYCSSEVSMGFKVLSLTHCPVLMLSY